MILSGVRDGLGRPYLTMKTQEFHAKWFGITGEIKQLAGTYCAVSRLETNAAAAILSVTNDIVKGLFELAEAPLTAPTGPCTETDVENHWRDQALAAATKKHDS